MDYSDNNEHPEILCYACHFNIRYGHESGMPGCDKSFVKAGIPTVSCQGPCSVSTQCRVRACVRACVLRPPTDVFSYIVSKVNSVRTCGHYQIMVVK